MRWSHRTIRPKSHASGAFHLLRRARRLFPFIERIFADGGYVGERMALAVKKSKIVFEYDPTTT